MKELWGVFVWSLWGVVVRGWVLVLPTGDWWACLGMLTWGPGGTDRTFFLNGHLTKLRKELATGTS